MKKTLSLILSLVMLFSVTAGLNLTAYAYADNPIDAEAIQLNGTWYNGEVSKTHNQDFFKLILNADSYLNVKAFAYNYLYVGLYDVNLNRIDSFSISYGGDSAPRFDAIDCVYSKGEYYLAVSNSEASREGYKYGVAVTAKAIGNNETEPNDYDHAMILPAGKTITGAVTAQDKEDWYKFTLRTAAKVKVFAQSEVSGCDIYSENMIDCIYQSYNPVCSEIFSLKAGTYYIRFERTSVGSGKHTVMWDYVVDAPTNLKASQGTNNVKLSWAKVSGATGYQVQQYKNNTWTDVKKVTANSLNVTGLKTGTDYKFRVRAYLTMGGRTVNSSFAAITSATKPSAVTLNSVKSNKSKQFTAKWKKTTGSGYQLQYSTASNFKGAKTVNVNAAKTTSKTIAKLKGKKKYYVRVRAYKTVNGTKIYGAWSKAKTVTTKK